MRLWCCQCRTEIEARLTRGAEVYPHRKIDMPEQIYAERDPETNEKLWFSTRGMGVEYVKATPERRWSFDCEWYLGGVRMQPGEYVVVRVGAPVNADTPF